jgi:hypothetical protein
MQHPQSAMHRIRVQTKRALRDLENFDHSFELLESAKSTMDKLYQTTKCRLHTSDCRRTFYKWLDGKLDKSGLQQDPVVRQELSRLVENYVLTSIIEISNAYEEKSVKFSISFKNRKYLLVFHSCFTSRSFSWSISWESAGDIVIGGKSLKIFPKKLKTLKSKLGLNYCSEYELLYGLLLMVPGGYMLAANELQPHEVMMQLEE